MTTYRVEVLRMVATTIYVEADSPEAAASEVQRADFDVPPISENDPVLEGWEYVVSDQDGDTELYRTED